MFTDFAPADRESAGPVLDLLPAGVHLLSASFGDARAAAVVRLVQQCSIAPPMLFVALEKGQALSPVIRDSRTFAVCILDPRDRTLHRHFSRSHESGSDPFLSLDTIRTRGGCPVPRRAIAYIDCQLSRHLDVDGDHEVYVGLVHDAVRLPPSAGLPQMRGNGANGHAAPARARKGRRARRA